VSSRIKFPACFQARVHPGVSRIVLLISILTVPLSLFAAAPLVTDNADNTTSLQAPDQSMPSASEAVAIDQSMPKPEPIIVSRDLEVLEAAVSVSQSGLDLEKDSSASTEMTEADGVALQLGPNQLAVLTSGLVRAGEQHRSDSTSALKASDAGDLGLAGESTDVLGEPVDKAGGFSTQQTGQDAKPHVAVVNRRVEGGVLQHIPIPVFLAVTALIALIPVSRRRVTHTDLSSMSKKNRPYSHNARLDWR
jgi:hypothetical protein